MNPTDQTHGIDLAAVRADTPICERKIHLNNAGSAPDPKPVLAAVEEHLRLESETGGYEAADLAQDKIDDAYQSVAALIGTSGRNMAFTQNSTTAYLQALSSIAFERGDVILTSNVDYISNQLMFLSLGKRFGVELLRAPDLPEGGVDPEAVASIIRSRRPRLVAITQAAMNSGLIQDVTSIGAACRKNDTLYLVDACQAVGQIRVDAEKIGCDFLAGTSRKFLRGPRGIGFLYISDRALAAGLEPLFIDMKGADWIAPDEYRPVDSGLRFQIWEFSVALAMGLGEAARYAMRVGPDAIERRCRALGAYARGKFSEIDGVRPTSRGKDLGAIVCLDIRGDDKEADIGKLVAGLRARDINASNMTAGFSVIDNIAKGIGDTLRVSPHYYNTAEEIDRSADALAELLPKT